MTKYFKLVRITAWPAALFVFALPFAVGATGATDLKDVLFGFLAAFSFLSFAFALNFYADRDTDKYHDGKQKDFDLSKQPLVTGEVTLQECKAFCTIAFLATIVFSFLVNTLFAFLIVSACLVGGVLYSHPRIRLKAKPLGDILCISFLGLLLPSAGYVLGSGIMPSWPMMLLWYLLTVTVFIPTVVSDYEFDLKAGLRTSAVVFGQRNLMKGMFISCLFSLPVAFLIVEGYYPLGTKAFALVAIASCVIVVAVAWKCFKPPRLEIPILASLPRWVFLSPGIGTALFISYGLFKILPHDPFQVFWNIFG